jgi:ribulose-phosphate 3-epimerase
MGVKVSASLMCADLARLGDEVRTLVAAGVDWLHFDIMDGHFVPNLTFGPDVVKALRPLTDLPFDVHLMVRDPERHIPAFIEAGADWLGVHQEACRDPLAALRLIRDAGARPGIAISPPTPVSALAPLIEAADLVLIMTVNPGFAGQTLVPGTIEKIAQARELIRASGRDIELQADGNVSLETAPAMVAAGATCLVGGSSSVFCRSEGDYATCVRRLRGGLERDQE